MLKDVAIPTDRNVMQMEVEKKLKYKSLCRDTTNVEHKMYDYTGDNWSHWNNNRKVSGKNTKAIAGKYSADSLQKTSHIIWKVLQAET